MKTFTQAIDDKSCLYPEGDAPDMTFCGQPRQRGRYCAHHYKLCRLPVPKPRPRAKERV